MNEPKWRHRGRTSNSSELHLMRSAEAEGWEVWKRGWPDFLLFKEGTIVLVEVKQDRFQNLRPQQYLIMRHLAEEGVPCYLWSPDQGFDRIVSSRPESPAVREMLDELEDFLRKENPR